MEYLLRGALAKQSGIHIETLRYYEKMGLIPIPSRTEAGYRLYPKTVLNIIEFIKNAKACGFKITEIQKALVRSHNSPVQMDEFIQVIDIKLKSLQQEIMLRELTMSKLVQLQLDLLKDKKNSDVEKIIDILKMTSITPV